MEQDLASQPSNIEPKKKMNTWKILTVVLALLFIAALFTRGFTLLNITGQAVLNENDAQTKANDFIQKYLVLPGVSITINDIQEESGLYRLDITADANGQQQDAKAYISKDGKLFFLQAIPLDEVDTLLQQQQAGVETPIDIGQPTEIILSEENDPALGSADAPITIIEFSDFECPFCSRFAKETFEDLKKEYIDTGKVRFIYKDFPLTSIHRKAMQASLAANCAFEQDKFWEYHDILYDNQNNLDINDLERYAEDLGLDTDKFNSCLDSEQYKDEIEADTKEGNGLGVRGTPTFSLNGRLLTGAIPFENFKEAIEEELAKV